MRPAVVLLLLLLAGPRAAACDGACAACEETIVRTVEAVAPSVASIVAEPAGAPHGEARHLGSAVVVDPGGFLLTNAHVVDGAARVLVVLPGRDPLEGRVLAAAPDHDLALLRVDSRAPLPAARLAPDDGARVGQTCLALGNALGLDSTVTRGIVSARGRRLVHEGRELGRDFLQTDATIHPGSSGGPLVDVHGRVLGITTAMEAGAAGVGFAIPVARARRVLLALGDPLVLFERWLGLELADAPDEAGARVVRVDAGGPAEAAGLRPGDVVTSAGPLPVRGAFQLQARFLGERADALRLSVVGSDGVSRGARLAAGPPPWTGGLARRLGLRVRAARAGSGAPPGRAEGLVVEDVDAGGPAHAIGLRKGDRIVRVEATPTRRTSGGTKRGQPFEDPRALWTAVQALPVDAAVGVTIRRDDREYWGEMRIR